MADGKPAHDWMLDVLRDLHDYADLNGLTRIAEGVATLLPVAKAEIAARDDGPPVH